MHLLSMMMPSFAFMLNLKAVCTVFRMAPSTMERVTIILPDMAATKLQWTLECLHGMSTVPNNGPRLTAWLWYWLIQVIALVLGIRKTYWITCTSDPDMHHVALDRKSFSSHLVVKPSDLNRLLANFQSSLQEITLIATEPSPLSSFGIRSSSEGKAIELRSYIDPAKGTHFIHLKQIRFS